MLCFMCYVLYAMFCVLCSIGLLSVMNHVARAIAREIAMLVIGYIGKVLSIRHACGATAERNG